MIREVNTNCVSKLAFKMTPVILASCSSCPCVLPSTLNVAELCDQ